MSDEQSRKNTNSGYRPESQDIPADWEEVSSDPDPQDLGYERSQWQRIPGSDATQTVLLPTDEAMLHEQRFIVLDSEGLCDLIRHR